MAHAYGYRVHVNRVIQVIQVIHRIHVIHLIHAIHYFHVIHVQFEIWITKKSLERLSTLTGRQIAFMTSAPSRSTTYNGMNDLLNTELPNDNFKMFDLAWEETLLAMDIEPDMVS